METALLPNGDCPSEPQLSTRHSLESPEQAQVSSWSVGRSVSDCIDGLNNVGGCGLWAARFPGQGILAGKGAN